MIITKIKCLKIVQVCREQTAYQIMKKKIVFFANSQKRNFN